MATVENPNYFPNSFDDIQIDQAYKPPFLKSSSYADSYDRIVKEKMIISQPGNLFKIMSAEQQQNTINNIVSHMSGIEGPKERNYQ
jgi:catalase